jgi:hypothetical protein
MALRIKELQEVLDKLGLRKTGRKADLQLRIMSVFSGDGAQRCGPRTRLLGCRCSSVCLF